MTQRPSKPGEQWRPIPGYEGIYEVPPEHRATSRVELYLGEHGYLEGYFDRPETESERAADKVYQALTAIADKGRR